EEGLTPQKETYPLQEEAAPQAGPPTARCPAQANHHPCLHAPPRWRADRRHWRHPRYPSGHRLRPCREPATAPDAQWHRAPHAHLQGPAAGDAGGPGGRALHDPDVPEEWAPLQTEGTPVSLPPLRVRVPQGR